MKKTRLLALILATLMVTGLCASAKIAYVPIKIAGSDSSSYTYLTTQQSSFKEVTDSQTVSQRIKTDKNICSVCFNLPSWNNDIGTITVTVYKWDNNLKTTLAGKPIGKESFKDTPDNSVQNVSVAANSGDILVHFSNGTDKMGVWTAESKSVPNTTATAYVNNEQIDGSVLMGFATSVLVDDSDISSENVRDAYEFIEPGSRDMLMGFTEQKNTDHYDGDGEETYYGMLNAPSSVDGAYALFKNVDFGETSPKRLLVRVFRNHPTNFSEIQFAIDSPTGDIIGSARWIYEQSQGKEKWMEFVSDIAVPVTGVHDLYLLYRSGGGYCVIGKFKFLKDDVPVNGFEKEVAEFKPVADEDLTYTYSDTWTATDMIGRKLPDNSTVGDIRPDKEIGLFYWTWHAQETYTSTAFSNNQSVVDNYTGDINEIKNYMNYTGWDNPGFWNESVYGYYTEFDTWVLRKQLELFSAAGVDFLATDCSNGASVFGTGAVFVMREMHKMRQLGYDVPGLTFILPWSANANTTTDLEQLYCGFYGSGLYSDCWYYRDGKPLVMAYPGGDLLRVTGNEKVDAMHQEISEFFTFRGTQPQYKIGQTAELQWPWLEVAPQHGFMKKSDGSYEIVAVSTAQNSNDDVESYTAMNGEGVYGRSYTYKDKHRKLSDTSVFYGYNFQEQWDNALAIDPEIIFVTGWNEWIAGHFAEGGGTGVPGAYVDQWIDEYSRDIEPTKGQFKDTYYMQMVANIRKFKGVSKTPVSENAKTIDVGGDFAQWADVGPEFIGYKGGTEERRGAGFDKMIYTNDTGRNDIVLSKVSHDAEKVYFYVETAENLTPSSDKNWMRLYINTDRKYSTGWEGYDFVVNRVSPTANEVIIEKCIGVDNTYKYTEVARAPYTVSGNKLMLEISKDVLGLADTLDIEFKWHDNGVNDGSVLDFYQNGDTAPVGRFNYRYVDSAAVNNANPDEPIDMNTNLDILTRKYIVMALNNPTAYAKGNRLAIDPDNEEIVPLIVNDKTLVPIRFITEALGAKVTWNEQTSAATIKLNGSRVIIKEGSDTIRIEQESLKLQTPAQTINDRMYVPLRDVSEAFGLDCYWADPGLIVIGNGALVTMLLNNDLTDRLLERFDLAQ